MKAKQLLLFLVPFIMVGCNKGTVNKTKSPFKDSYNPIGMKGEYTISDSIKSPDDYNNLRKSINDYENIDNKSYVLSTYTRTEETRDLKAAYFGKNLGAANLCSFLHQVTTNTRYQNNVTTKFTTAHKENQNVSGGINKNNPVVNDYIYQTDTGTSGNHPYQVNQQTWDDTEPKATKTIKSGYFNFDTPTGTEEKLIDVFGLKAYKDDIKNNFGEITRREEKIIFNVLGDNNNAVYGMSGDKYLIKEAASLYVPYLTTVGDKYKAVNNFFYEALLEKVGENFRFTNFRFYTELLILSEAVSDEERVPIVYLEKPQLVEYSEIKYSINYANNISELPEFNKGDIPQP